MENTHSVAAEILGLVMYSLITCWTASDPVSASACLMGAEPLAAKVISVAFYASMEALGPDSKHGGDVGGRSNCTAGMMPVPGVSPPLLRNNGSAVKRLTSAAGTRSDFWAEKTPRPGAGPSAPFGAP